MIARNVTSLRDERVSISCLLERLQLVFGSERLRCFLGIRARPEVLRKFDEHLKLNRELEFPRKPYCRITSVCADFRKTQQPFSEHTDNNAHQPDATLN